MAAAVLVSSKLNIGACASLSSEEVGRIFMRSCPDYRRLECSVFDRVVLYQPLLEALSSLGLSSLRRFQPVALGPLAISLILGFVSLGFCDNSHRTKIGIMSVDFGRAATGLSTHVCRGVGRSSPGQSWRLRRRLRPVPARLAASRRPAVAGRPLYHPPSCQRRECRTAKDERYAAAWLLQLVFLAASVFSLARTWSVRGSRRSSNMTSACCQDCCAASA